jgi:hypothetical protein
MHLSRFRMMIQTASTVLSNGYVGAFVTKAVNSNPLKGVCVPYLNCYACPSALFSCPIGTMQHFMAIREIPYLLIAMLGAVGITVGRMACGWACPFGFLQDLIYKIKSRKFMLPWYLKYFKYGFLAIFVLFLPYVTGDTWFSKICPMGTLTAGIPWMAWNPDNPATGLPVLPSAPGSARPSVRSGPFSPCSTVSAWCAWKSRSIATVAISARKSARWICRCRLKSIPRSASVAWIARAAAM